MKKRLILVGAVALTLLTAGSAMAAPRSGNGTCDGTGLGIGNDGVRQYVNCEVDGDGICDLGTQPQDGTGMQYHGQR
ncbi:hypothetical protein [Acetobacterium wieringae]|uniref:hypothetical protein n=1 Tax=Acetobacterium wieringae TaxID=52694 RepID=UPI0026F1FE9A|nr:hypothetical protein [Acetobacterium wieringae]